MSNESTNYEKIIFEEYYHRVYRAAYYIIKDEHLAQDIVQEAFLKAFEQMDSLKDGEKLGAWLATIATRTAIDFLRKKKNKRNYIPIEDVYIDKGANLNSPVEEKVEYELLKDMIKKNLHELEPPEYRQIILLKYKYYLSDQEMAEFLDIKLGAAKSRLYRARLKLKKILVDHLEGRSDRRS